MIHVFDSRNRSDVANALTPMYEARAEIFGRRLGWSVSVHNGLEIDNYDRNHHPLYVVCSDNTGRLVGSLRVLRGDGPLMLDDEFADFFDVQIELERSAIWECTRFCVHPAALDHDIEYRRYVSTELLAGLCAAALAAGTKQIIGVFEAPMARVYRRIGWCPDIIAKGNGAAAGIHLGIWEVSEAALARLHDNLEPARCLAA